MIVNFSLLLRLFVLFAVYLRLGYDLLPTLFLSLLLGGLTLDSWLLN